MKRYAVSGFTHGKRSLAPSFSASAPLIQGFLFISVFNIPLQYWDAVIYIFP